MSCRAERRKRKFTPILYMFRATVTGHLHTVTYTRGRIDTIDSPYDGHLVARNMYRNGINKKIVRHVGHLQRL